MKFTTRVALGAGATALSLPLFFVVEGRLGDDLDPVSPTVTVPIEESIMPVRYNPCFAEDEVMVTLTKDAFDMKAGESFCVHHDFLRDPKS